MHKLVYQIIIIFITIFLYNSVIAIEILKDNNFLSADKITYDSNTKCINASGHVRIIAEGYVITADDMIYDIKNDELFANGNVRVKSDNNTAKDKKFQVDGSSIFFENKMKSGLIKNFIIYFGDNAILASNLATRVDENHSILTKSEYTACDICDNRNPLWSISAQKADIDTAKEKVIYKNVFFKLYGLPIFFTPYFAHPTPKAKAQSGFLIPSKNKAGIGIPIYYRPKDNFDNTITPRLNHSGLIIENETRYLAKEGLYKTNFSFVKSNITRVIDDKTKKNKYDRFYIQSKADLQKNNYNYGFDFNKTSDKAYLKEYYDRNDPHLTSNIYIEEINKQNFARIDGLYFQELKASNQKDHNSYALPEIRIKHVTPVLDDSTYFTLENNSVNYSESSNYNVARNNLTTILSKKYKTSNGHLINLSGYNRADFYYINIDNTSRLAKNGIATRNIPEIHLEWQRPMIKRSSNGYTTLEPHILYIEGLGDYNKNLKYDYVDVNAYDINEVNLFQSNRYSGFDFHEYGRRISYGMNAQQNTSNSYVFKGFIGKLDYLPASKAPHKTANILVKSSGNYDNIVELYYNAKLYCKKYSKYREEIGAWYDNQKVYANINFINVKPSIYYAKDSINIYNPAIKQMYIDTKYRINSSWSIGYDIRFDLASYKKISPISRNIKMTYTGDCVSISLRIGRIYAEDQTRGIYKTDSSSVALSLKTLSF